MAYEQLCMYCFEDLQGQTVCPHCGRDSSMAVPQIQMLPGTLVYRNRFLVGRALGQDATGIVYAAYDTKRENKLRLREYLPRDCAERLNDGSVVPMAGLEDQFEKGMRKLRASVEGVDDPRKRHFYFEENGTAYIAQRKSGGAAAAAARDDEDDDRRAGARQMAFIIGGAVVFVVIAAVVIVSLLGGALRNADDVVQNPTLGPTSSNSLWAPEITPSPTPYASPTFSALVDPEQSWMDYTYAGDVNQEFNQQQSQASKPTKKPTPVPTLQPEATKFDNTINQNSGVAEVTALQQRLAQLGWLSYDQISGSYDSATRQAVRDFQSYINTVVNPSEKLTVDGVAGPKTQQWLYSVDAIKPTAEPTPMVTPNPDDGTVDQDSPRDEIRDVQRKLIILGLMKSGSDDGVYGSTTVAAVKKFQQRVNQLQGYNALEITGVMDPTSMAYLDYYVEWWMSMQQATATPEPVLPVTPAPTEAPSPTPTAIPDKPEEDNRVDQDSPKESIAFVQEMLISVGLLPEGSNDGVYDDMTVNAVVKFQQWVNDVRGDGTLSVTGIADQNTLNYLEYAYGNGMTVNPTAAPTDAPEQGDQVGPDSSKESIAFVQGMLVSVGLLPEGSDDGVYGRGTSNAVAQFQQWVNSVRGEGTLNVSGVVDKDTMSYLEYAFENGMTAPGAPTNAPSAEPTSVPTPDPEPTDVPEQDNRVDQNSPKESIAFMQNMLISVGLLPEGSDDGVYGNGTSNAVAQFQQWVNSVQGEGTLEVTGIADQDTLNYLEYAFENDMMAPGAPTDAPTNAPTPDPTDVPEQDNRVDKDSPKESIAFVQSMLVSVGLLPEGSDDGVYGSGTSNAVAQFQQWVNSVRGEGTLEVTGVADQDTLNYLEYAFGNGMSAVPTQQPTAEPTEDPEPDEGSFQVGPDSPKESIQYLQGMMIEAGLLQPGSDDGVYGRGTAAAIQKFQQYMNANYLGAGTLPEDGMGDSLTLSYLEEFISRGLTMPADPTEEPTKAPSVPVEIDLKIEGAEVISGVHALTGDRIRFEWEANVPCEYYIYIIDADGGSLYSDEASDRTQGVFGAEALKPGMVYTIQIGALPLDGSAEDLTWTEAKFGVQASSVTPAPTDEPEKPGVIESLSLKINGLTPNGMAAISGSTAVFEWKATGDVEYYSVFVEDSRGGQVVGWENTDRTQGSFDVGSLRAGEVYTIRVGAVPVNGGEVTWTEAQFMVPQQDEVTAPVIRVETPSYLEEETGILHLTGMEAILSWTNEGMVSEYQMYMVNSQQVRRDLPPTTETKWQFALSALPADTYRLYIGAVPTGMEGDEDAIQWTELLFVIDPVVTE